MTMSIFFWGPRSGLPNLLRRGFGGTPCPQAGGVDLSSVDCLIWFWSGRSVCRLVVCLNLAGGLVCPGCLSLVQGFSVFVFGLALRGLGACWWCVGGWAVLGAE